MSIKNNSNLSSSKFCYYTLKGSRLLLADECNKKKLLDIVHEVSKCHAVRFYAFCLTDEDAHFIFMDHRDLSAIVVMQEIAEQFLKQCAYSLPRIAGIQNSFVPKEQRCTALEKEVKELCRMLHRLPLEKCYVQRIADYWWSSYVTHAAIFEREIVDRAGFLSMFSDDLEEAQIKMMFFHNRRKYERCLLNKNEK